MRGPHVNKPQRWWSKEKKAKSELWLVSVFREGGGDGDGYFALVSPRHFQMSEFRGPEGLSRGISTSSCSFCVDLSLVFCNMLFSSSIVLCCCCCSTVALCLPLPLLFVDCAGCWAVARCAFCLPLGSATRVTRIVWTARRLFRIIRTLIPNRTILDFLSSTKLKRKVPFVYIAQLVLPTRVVKSCEGSYKKLKIVTVAKKYIT